MTMPLDTVKTFCQAMNGRVFFSIVFFEPTLFVTRFLVPKIILGICKFKMELGGGARIFWGRMNYDEPMT